MTKIKPVSTRRKFLKVLGGGVILAAGASTYFATTRTPNKAIEPWKLALGTRGDTPNKEDPRRIILSHAILAPNPHNRQPWVVDLSTPDEMVLYCDKDKKLPHTDPYDRQITIGLGCFLELANMTANEMGMKADITLFPQGETYPRLDDKPIASIRLSKDENIEKDPLFNVIFDRRSNKDPFDVSKKPVEMDVLNINSSARSDVILGYVLSDARIANLRAITRDAMLKELHTYETNKESIELMRMGKAEINANPDGIDMGGVFLESLSLLGHLEREDLLNPESATFKNSIPIIIEPIETAMGYVYVKTKGNSRKDQIAAGRSYVRMNLKANQMGIAIHPLSQALQEYEEVGEYYDAIRGELQVGDEETLQMFARIGYGEKSNPSPRWHYEAKIKAS